MSISSKLSELDQIAKTEDKVKAYSQLIDAIFTEKDDKKAHEVLEHVLDDNFATVVCRDIINHFSKSLSVLPNNSVLDIGNMALEMIQSKLNMLEEEDAFIRKEVAHVYHVKKEFAQSAKVLQKIKLENTTRKVSDFEKAETYVTIAENWFYQDDAVNAEMFLNKATHVILDVEDADLNIRYRYCKAKVFDSKRKFLLASQAYYELSNNEGGKIDEGDLLALLKSSVTCTILSPAGPRKSATLTTLYKDERTRSLDNFDILAKMFNERVISKEDSKKFENTLEEHQQATASGGITVLEKAVLEHNIQVVSNIYQTISFEGLGTFLGISQSDAQKLISEMATEGRITATLDQKDQIIEFKKNEIEKLATWNEQIGTLCNDINSVLTKIIVEYPEAKKFEVK